MVLDSDLPEMRFDHVGVIVPTLEDGRNHLSALFGIVDWTVEFDDPLIQVRVQFGRDRSGLCYETVAPFGENSPVRRTLRKADRILNHVAYLVPRLAPAAIRLRERYCIQASEAMPAVAYGGALVQFFMTPLGFLLELMEAPTHQHVFISAGQTVALAEQPASHSKEDSDR